MKVVVIAMLLLGAGFVAVAAAPTASACVIWGPETAVHDAVVCANRGVDSAQCIATGHCD